MAEEIRGWNALMGKIDALSGPKMKALNRKALSRVAMAHQAAAKMMAPTGSGELKNSIHTDIKEDESGAVASVYTNADHAAYIEYGTGPVGAASGGNGSDATVSYAMGPFRHKSSRGKVFYTDYWVYKDPVSGKFFATRGQPARPFMYPSAKKVKRQAHQILTAAAKQFLSQSGV